MNQINNDEGELLVWGYACKLFRDDEKAELVDSGRHLIPWMGDEHLMIDRYDGRGALYDLASHEAAGTWELTAEEKEEERACDRERYAALYQPDTDTQLYKEEEEKRIQGRYGQVAYSYEEGATAGCEPPAPAATKPYVAPPGLPLPPEMTLPDTMRQHAIIVKTAAFISAQGSQMEILMRLKQSSNRQFDFLNPGDPLQGYYKHLVSCIKAGTYAPSEQDTSCLDDEPEEDGTEHYLHPSLAPAPPPPPDPNDPPPLVRQIIDTMVKYISKNGLIFEEAIRKRNDPRFSFLDSSDTYYNFYRDKVTSAFSVAPTVTAEEPAMPVEVKKKRKPMPVSFSIKKAKDNEGLEVASALPVEESSDSEEDLASPPPPLTDSPSSPNPQAKDKPTDTDLQKERKLKVAQFLKGLKNK